MYSVKHSSTVSPDVQLLFACSDSGGGSFLFIERSSDFVAKNWYQQRESSLEIDKLHGI
ncbi:hypothetical protein CEXT_9061, partial [Caerostris extrusa]